MLRILMLVGLVVGPVAAHAQVAADGSIIPGSTPERPAPRESPNPEQPRPRTIVSIGDASGGEGGTLVFTITRSGNTAGTLMLMARTSDGNARARQDYQPVTKPIILAPGATSATISVPTIAGGDVRPLRNFTVSLASLASSVTFRRSAGTGTIEADVPPPPVKPTPTPPPPQPSPTATKAPRPTPTPAPTPAPAPTPPPVASPTTAPTPTPSPSASPTPEASPSTEATPGSEVTPSPTDTAAMGPGDDGTDGSGGRDNGLSTGTIAWIVALLAAIAAAAAFTLRKMVAAPTPTVTAALDPPQPGRVAGDVPLSLPDVRVEAETAIGEASASGLAIDHEEIRDE